MLFLLSSLEEKIERKGECSTGKPAYGVGENNGDKAVGNETRHKEKVELSYTDKAGEHCNHRHNAFAKSSE